MSRVGRDYLQTGFLHRSLFPEKGHLLHRRRLNGEYVLLKNDTAEVEKILRNVYDIMSEETRREQPKRVQDMEM